MNRLYARSATTLAGVGLLSAGLLVGCGQSKPQPAQSAAPPPAADLPADLSDHPKLVAPLQGEVSLEFLQPDTKRDKDLVVTKIQVKNTANGAIAGLKVREDWLDKAGNPLSGSEDRLRKLLMPGETATLTLTAPFNSKMDHNHLMFSHANGSIQPKEVKSFDETKDAKGGASQD